MSALRDVIPDAAVVRLTLAVGLWAAPAVAPAGTIEFRGEASASGILSSAPTADAQWRVRYLPELTAELELGRT